MGAARLIEMCGINGIFAYHYAANPIDRAELRRTRDHMAARGPDGTGEWISADERVGFGHQRLAIIDLSEAGMQPMASADGKLLVTYNGEMSTFVSVGNAHQPFTRLLTAVAAIAGSLPQPVTVQHGHTPFRNDSCRSLPFLEMSDFERMIGDSRLVILQAGGGGILQALRSGKIPVVVPRLQQYGEVIDDHQVHWARALSETRRVILVEDVALLLSGAREAMLRQSAGSSALREVAMVRLVADALRRG
jgi:UDP-N-acetylglucosamine transferase subunit ALG13